MFLSILNEEDKLNFIEFIHLVANCDEDFADEEKEILNNYMIETGIDSIPDIGKSIDDILLYFSKRDDSIKKVVLFEVYGLILSDDKLSKEEKEILNKIDKLSGLNNEEVNKIKELVEELKKVYDNIYDILFKTV